MDCQCEALMNQIIQLKHEKQKLKIENDELKRKLRELVSAELKGE